MVLLSMCRCRVHKTVGLVEGIVTAWRWRGECLFYRSQFCLQNVFGGGGLKSRLPVAKMHQGLSEVCGENALSYRTVARWVDDRTISEASWCAVRAVGHSVADVNKQHRADYILRFTDIGKR